MKSKYACPECGGRGLEEHSECGGLLDECEACQGSGLDADRVDVAAIRAAVEALQAETGLIWGLLENGKLVGHMSKVRTVRIADFLKQETQT